MIDDSGTQIRRPTLGQTPQITTSMNNDDTVCITAMEISTIQYSTFLSFTVASWRRLPWQIQLPQRRQLELGLYTACPPHTVAVESDPVRKMSDLFRTAEYCVWQSTTYKFLHWQGQRGCRVNTAQLASTVPSHSTRSHTSHQLTAIRSRDSTILFYARRDWAGLELESTRIGDFRNLDVRHGCRRGTRTW